MSVTSAKKTVLMPIAAMMPPLVSEGSNACSRDVVW